MVSCMEAPSQPNRFEETSTIRDTTSPATERDRQWARTTKRVIIGWTVIWSAIIAFLFLFGETLMMLFA